MKSVTTRLGEFAENEMHVEDGGYMWLHMSRQLSTEGERFLHRIANRGKHPLSVTVFKGRLLVETGLEAADVETIEKLVRGFLLRVKEYAEKLDHHDIRLYTRVLDLRAQLAREQDEVYHESLMRH